VIHNDEWWFSLVDITGALAESANPRSYWNALKRRIIEESGDTQLSTEIRQLRLLADDMRLRETDCATAETVFRVVQSIRSKHAEPFKRWLARVAYERVLEAQNPEIAIKRAIANYEIQGRDRAWIRRRLEGIVSRHALTSEWKARGVKGAEYGILTDDISRGTFSITTRMHKDFKGLKSSHQLRDHMSPLELVLTTLGEEATREIAVSNDAQGFPENQKAAIAGGRVAGDARRQIEKASGKKVVTESNFLPPAKKAPLIPPPIDNEFDDDDPPVD
jgi:hypothetical protein